MPMPSMVALVKAVDKKDTATRPMDFDAPVKDVEAPPEHGPHTWTPEGNSVHPNGIVPSFDKNGKGTFYGGQGLSAAQKSAWHALRIRHINETLLPLARGTNAHHWVTHMARAKQDLKTGEVNYTLAQRKSHEEELARLKPEVARESLIKGQSFYGGKWYGSDPNVGAKDKIHAAVSKVASHLNLGAGLSRVAGQSGLRHVSTTVGGGGGGAKRDTYTHHFTAASGSAASSALGEHLGSRGFTGIKTGRTIAGGAIRHAVSATGRDGSVHNFHIEERPWTGNASPQGRGPAPGPKRDSVIRPAKPAAAIRQTPVAPGSSRQSPEVKPSASPSATPAAAPSAAPAVHSSMAPIQAAAASHRMNHVGSRPVPIKNMLGKTTGTRYEHFFTHRNPEQRIKMLHSSLAATHHISAVQKRRVYMPGGKMANQYSFTATPHAGGPSHTISSMRGGVTKGISR